MSGEDEFLGSVVLPAPPAQLRARTLTAALAAARERRGRKRAGFGFGRLDLVWAGALLVVVAGHVLLSLRPAGRGSDRQLPAPVTSPARQAAPGPNLATRAGLPAAWIEMTPPPSRDRGREDWHALRVDALFRDL